MMAQIRELAREHERRYRERNREMLCEKARVRAAEYYRANHDKINKKRREQRVNFSEEDRKRDRHRQWRNKIRRDFNMTEDDYNTILTDQDGTCKLCGKAPEENGRRLAVDHVHDTGKVRALLCIVCNVEVGTVEKNLHRLQDVVNYIEENKT